MFLLINPRNKPFSKSVGIWPLLPETVIKRGGPGSRSPHAGLALDGGCQAGSFLDLCVCRWCPNGADVSLLRVTARPAHSGGKMRVH